MLWNMFGEAIELAKISEEDEKSGNRDGNLQERFCEAVVHDYTDIAEMYDIAEWYMD